MKRRAKLYRGLAATLGFVLAITMCASVLAFDNPGAVNNALGIVTNTTAVSSDTQYFKTDYTADGLPSADGLNKLRADEKAFNTMAEAEGSVLLKNDGTLPFSSDVKKVTLFGHAVADAIYNSDYGVDKNQQVTFEAAMKEAFEINQTLYDAYAQSSTKRVKSSGEAANIGEEPKEFYTADLKATFNNYKDAAIVMFTREAGEGDDLSMKDSEGISQLALHQSEKDLLTMIKDAGFTKVVVLINSAYPMELGFVEEEEYGVNACLWIGNPGTYGFAAIPKILTGELEPSGRLIDTFAANSLSSAAVQNAGNFRFSNTDSSYLVYAESIYSGYKYYETRYEDVILGRHNADTTKGSSSNSAWNYAEEICYPFGFGLSYTSFEQTLKSVEWDHAAKTVTVTVNVKNTGSRAGKDVIQLYVQTPYTQYDKEHLVEKSAIQLLDYTKTDELAPGADKDYTIVADEYLFASYDVTANGGAGGYILDDGDYYFAIGNGAHDALNNVLAAKGATGMYTHDGTPTNGVAAKAAKKELAAFDSTSHKTSMEGGGEVKNQFTGVDIYAVDYNYYKPGTITYLTRQDWNTYPDAIKGLEETDRMQTIHSNGWYNEIVPSDAPSFASFTQNQYKGINLIDVKDYEFDDDDKWNTFLDQMTVAQLASSLAENYGSSMVKSSNDTTIRPSSNHQDAPDAMKTKYAYGDRGTSTSYVNAGIIAASFNKEIAAKKGYFMGEDAIYCRVNINWGPGANLHRNIFCGRNNCYFSEDSVLSYITCALETKEMVAKGLVTGVKHFVANDQETNRSGVETFMTEQTLRENELRAFEGAFTKGDANGIMSSYNALGSCYTAVNHALLTSVLRNEWGFTGIAITDAGSCSNVPFLALAAGTNMFCFQTKIDQTIVGQIGSDGFALSNIRSANKEIYYTFSHASLTNGLVSGVSASETIAWWQPAVIALNAVIGVATLGFVGLYAYSQYFSKKKEG